MAEQVACKGCGKPILWARLIPDGSKMIPLDTRPAIYELTSAITGEVTCARADARFAVSHFATCPKANEFSGTSKREPAGG